MFFPLKVKKHKISCLILFVCLAFFTTSSCSWFSSEEIDSEQQKNGLTNSQKMPTVEEAISSINKIYIQSFTGPKRDLVRDIFYQALQERGDFQILELLPDTFENTGVLRIRVLNHNIWDIEEKINLLKHEIKEDGITTKNITRRNANVSVKLSFFDAGSGLPLIRSIFSQPFQQIYVSDEALKNRIKEEEELDRLTKILAKKIQSAFDALSEGEIELQLKEGQDHSWIGKNLWDLGNRRILKGNELALSGDYDKAIRIWQIVLYGPEEGEDENIYLKNRTIAFFNLGSVFHQKKNWLMAANMFSRANRLEQTQLYAQNWGDNMQLWLEEQERLIQEEANKKKRKKPVEKKKIEIAKPDIVKEIESNENLLLKPLSLWPYEPKIKKASEDDMLIKDINQHRF